MKAVIIGTCGHIDLALGVRDRLPDVEFVGIARGPRTRTPGTFWWTGRRRT